ncbi:MAG: hypothetical protein EBU90_04505 [Proteobacteria bacterium]|nr:hypothetical protein [Pseudomonadota bacterium]NBP15020.1 hypothetical protein [bacterium]
MLTGVSPRRVGAKPHYGTPLNANQKPKESPRQRAQKESPNLNPRALNASQKPSRLNANPRQRAQKESPSPNLNPRQRAPNANPNPNLNLKLKEVLVGAKRQVLVGGKRQVEVGAKKVVDTKRSVTNATPL